MYNFTNWLDHVTFPSDLFTITDNGDGTYTIKRAGEVMQQGTPQDQQHFNNMENGIVDAHVALAALLNFTRQNAWEIERGSVDLTNSEIFPFNNSIQTVNLTKEFGSKDYLILTEIDSAVGNVGEIEISDKLVNGFKIAFTGSGETAKIKYTVLGGLLR